MIFKGIKFGKEKSKLVVFYAALVTLDHDGPCIFAGYWGSVDEARAYVEKIFPNRVCAIYDKIFLDSTPAVMDIKKLPKQEVL